MKRWRGLAAVLLLVGLACAQQTASWQDTGTDLGALKQRFNQDVSSPRVLMLVSPT